MESNIPVGGDPASDQAFNQMMQTGNAAQQISPDAAAGMMAFFAGFFIFMMIFFIILYVFYAVCLMKIANKSNTPNAWFAWIPILNVILMLQIAKKPLWWIILFLIPFVNIVMMIVVWMQIAKAVNKPEWLGILMIVPIANLIIPAYLAFSKNDGVKPVIA